MITDSSHNRTEQTDTPERAREEGGREAADSHRQVKSEEGRALRRRERGERLQL